MIIVYCSLLLSAVLYRVYKSGILCEGCEINLCCIGNTLEIWEQLENIMNNHWEHCGTIRNTLNVGIAFEKLTMLKA